MDLIHKQASPEEIHIAYRLLKLAALRLKENGVDQWAYWLDPPAYKVQWLENGFKNGEYYFVFQNNEIIGMYRLSSEDLDYWGQQTIEARYVHSLIVHPNHKGKQIGKLLLIEMEKGASRSGIDLLRLDCHAGNTRLCRYYEEFGFKKVGEKLMPHSLNNLYEKKL